MSLRVLKSTWWASTSVKKYKIVDQKIKFTCIKRVLAPILFLLLIIQYHIPGKSKAKGFICLSVLVQGQGAAFGDGLLLAMSWVGVRWGEETLVSVPLLRDHKD